MQQRRFEDKVTIEEVLKENTSKELTAKMYIQLCRQNGIVSEMKKDIDYLQDETKKKMDWENVKRLTVILGILITALTLPQLIIKIAEWVG